MVASYSIKKGIGAGAFGGACAGFIMLAVMSVTTTQMGMSAKTFPILIGVLMGQGSLVAAKVGLGVHIIVSVAIGVIFGAVISNERFRLTSYKKGVALGITFGLIAFGVLFWSIVTSILVLPMMGLMHTVNPNMPETAIVQKIQAMGSTLTGGALVAHMIYGAVLGGIASAILWSTYQCKICHIDFANKKEFREHNERRHTQVH